MTSAPTAFTEQAPSAEAARWVAAVVTTAGALERVFGDPTRPVGRIPGWDGAAGDAYRLFRQRFADRFAVRLQGLRAVARAGELWLRAPVTGEGPFVAALEHASGGGSSRLNWVQAQVPTPGTPPELVARWWQRLTPDERIWVEALAGPGLGALGGVPLAVRDRVNRVTLRHDLAVDARSAAVRRALEPQRGERTWLLEYARDTHDGDGTAVIGLGDLEHDPRLVLLVPGVGSDAADAPQGVAHLRALRAESGAGTSAVWWLDYDAPDGPHDPSVLTRARADAGGAALLADLAGIEAARDRVGDGSTRRTTLLGHSYGAATVASGLSAAHTPGGGGAVPDAVVLAGAPGAPGAGRAADLGVREVYVARDSRDAVATLGSEGVFTPLAATPGIGLGDDPSTEAFGALRLRAERHDRGSAPSVGPAHTSYFAPGSESLTGIGAVVRGEVTQQHLAAPTSDPWWRPPIDPEWRRSVEP